MSGNSATGKVTLLLGLQDAPQLLLSHQLKGTIETTHQVLEKQTN